MKHLRDAWDVLLGRKRALSIDQVVNVAEAAVDFATIWSPLRHQQEMEVTPVVEALPNGRRRFVGWKLTVE